MIADLGLSRSCAFAIVLPLLVNTYHNHDYLYMQYPLSPLEYTHGYMQTCVHVKGYRDALFRVSDVC